MYHSQIPYLNNTLVALRRGCCFDRGVKCFDNLGNTGYTMYIVGGIYGISGACTPDGTDI
jgi:hypothetical protein